MNENPQRISRRAALRRASLLLGGVVSAPTLAGLLAGCERPRGVGDWRPSMLSEAQAEMVAVIGEHILPETDTPGARTARVHEFIDVMLSEYYPPEERERFLAGLQRVDARAQRVRDKPFLELTNEEQLELVRALNRMAFSDPESREKLPGEEPVLQETDVERGRSNEEDLLTPSGAVVEDEEWDPGDLGRESFFRTLKELVLVGYYTSEAGATQELRLMPVMGPWRADVPYPEIGHAWA